MKKTPLYDVHMALGAKMAPFGGFDMPIQYPATGIIKEHLATREKAAIFDTCHMGEFRVSGPNTAADLDKLVTPHVASIPQDRCRYFVMCNEDGGVIDDLIIYRMDEIDFFIVVNAGTQDNDFEWIKRHLSSDTTIENESETTAKIDLQGPDAPKILTALLDESIADMKYFEHRTVSLLGERVLISRTGYTGEIGFEIYCPADMAHVVWNACAEAGAVPAGLGARDTLRLEAYLPLHGHELTPHRNAAMCGMPRLISEDKEYVGSNVLIDPSNRTETLAALLIDGRRAAREGDTVIDSTGQVVGTVSSGAYSPSLGQAIALAYISVDSAQIGSKLIVKTARAELEATVDQKPLYKHGTARKPMTEFLPA